MLFTSLLASGALSMALSSSASALTLGLMWSGNNSFSASEMEAVQRSGASVFHMPIELNGTKNGTDWSTYDLIFDAARKHGITIAPVLIRTNAEGNRFPVAAEYPAWNEWVEKVVKRYGPGGDFWKEKQNPLPVTVWTVWNEPNLPINNPLKEPGTNSVQPENYGRFLVSTSAAIRSVHNGATVLVGGLFMPGGEFYSSFLQKAASVPGAPIAYDGVNIHPYSFYGKIAELAEQVGGVRFALDHHVAGGAGKPLWIGEIGWPVANPQKATEDREFNEGKRSKPGIPPVSEAEQATLLIQSFDWIKTEAAAKNIQAAFWYNVRDAPLGARWESFCGLRDQANGSFRRAWWAFQEVAGVPFWPVASNWFSDNLGGTITSDPDISSWGLDRVDVFAKGTENALWTRTWNGSAWSVWGFLGGTLTSGPGAVSWGNNRIDVVARAANGSVAHWWWNGAGWFTDNLGGTTPSDPELSSWGPDRLDVFVRGAENSLAPFLEWGMVGMGIFQAARSPPARERSRGATTGSMWLPEPRMAALPTGGGTEPAGSPTIWVGTSFPTPRSPRPNPAVSMCSRRVSKTRCGTGSTRRAQAGPSGSGSEDR